MIRKHICIISPVFNEKGNITELYNRITSVMKTIPDYTYEIRLIDNCSTDGTQEEIRYLASQDSRLKAIFNVRNFGPVRSPIYNLYMSDGDAVIVLASDLEDPPELIPEFLKNWESGYKLVMAVRKGTDEKGIMPYIRNIYYSTIQYLAEATQLPYSTGFGLYDKIVIETLRKINDPYPYLRGLICELGWPIATVSFHKPYRKRGVSSYNFLKYTEEGMLGIVSQSRMPLHLICMLGIGVSGISFIIGLYYLILKIFNWDSMSVGIAPAIIGLFFLMGVLFLVIGIIGEYIGLLVSHIVRRPLVIEKERINFLPSSQDKSFNQENSSEYEQ